jgi:periplasmic copper chaperone A
MRKRLGASVALAIGGLVLFAAPALAHVTIDPSTATRGSTTKLVFRVRNEVAVASTVKFAVKFDEHNPIPSVSVKPKTGWTATVTHYSLRAPLQTDDGQVTEAVSQIEWSGGTIAPEQFDEFEVDAGPLPGGIDLLLFPSIQTYSDGTEVDWIQQPFAGQPAPDHPAPLLKLTAAEATASSTTTKGGTSTLAIAALLIGSAGVGIGSWAWYNVRRWR